MPTMRARRSTSASPRAGSPDEVRSYFVDQFKKQDVDASLTGDAVSGKSKDGSAFVIHVAQAQTGSQGKIEIQSKD